MAYSMVLLISCIFCLMPSGDWHVFLLSYLSYDGASCVFKDWSTCYCAEYKLQCVLSAESNNGFFGAFCVLTNACLLAECRCKLRKCCLRNELIRCSLIVNWSVSINKLCVMRMSLQLCEFTNLQKFAAKMWSDHQL